MPLTAEDRKVDQVGNWAGVGTDPGWTQTRATHWRGRCLDHWAPNHAFLLLCCLLCKKASNILWRPLGIRAMPEAKRGMSKICASPKAPPLPLQRPGSALSHQEVLHCASQWQILTHKWSYSDRLPSSWYDSPKKINISLKYFDWPADNVNTRGTDYPC